MAYMNIEDYTTEELQAELKRRMDAIKAEKGREMAKIKRCRHCKHLLCLNWRNEEVDRNDKRASWIRCKVTIVRGGYNKSISKSTRACEKFEEYTEDKHNDETHL